MLVSICSMYRVAFTLIIGLNGIMDNSAASEIYKLVGRQSEQVATVDEAVKQLHTVLADAPNVLAILDRILRGLSLKAQLDMLELINLAGEIPNEKFLALINAKRGELSTLDFVSKLVSRPVPQRLSSQQQQKEVY